MRSVYPKSGRQQYDGGLNNKFERSIILDNESPDCANVVFSNGSVATREGITQLNTTPVGSFVVDGIYTRRTSSGSETMVVFAGGTMWQLGGTTFTTISSAQSVFTAGIRVSTTQYQDHMFIGNGSVGPYKYNGTDFTRHGVPAPSAIPTVASNAAGPLTGGYRYKITYVNSALAEGNPTSNTVTFTAAGAVLRLTNIPTAPQSFGVSARRIYRTVAGGSEYKRVATLSDNTTTTYDDSTADSALGAAAPSDNGEPPVYSVCVYHQNRLFVNDASNPNYVWYSEIGEPFTFKATSFRRIGDDAGDVVKGLAVYNNSVVAYCEKSPWLIYMPDTDPANWQDIKVKSQYGSKSPYSYFDFDNMQMFAATQNDKFVGFASLMGDAVGQNATLLTVSTAGSDKQSERIEPDIFDIQESFIGNISAIVFQNKAYITVTFGASNIRNNRIYIFDFSYSSLSKQKYSWVPWTNISASQFTIYNGKLYAGSSNADGKVHQLNNGSFSDNGSSISSYFYTKEFAGYNEHTNNFKDFRYTDILVEKLGDYFMNVTYRTDSDLGAGTTQQIDLNPGGSLWGTMTWGTDVWGGGTAQQKIRLSLGTAKGNRIQYKFDNQNTAGQGFKVHWQNFTYNLKGDR